MSARPNLQSDTPSVEDFPGLPHAIYLPVEWLVVGAILLIAALAHGINMGNFPYFENDEGTYVSQAWSVLREGQLSPYFYIYDHPPAGWIQLAIWYALTGGVHAFGTSIESGRVLMLLVQIGSTFLVYRITRNISGKVWVGLLSAILFSLSAYGIYYHRRILLDNFATFWVLLSILLLLPSRAGLVRLALSGAALGVGILSKEVVVVFLPALAGLVLVQANPLVRFRRGIWWLIWAGIILALYVLYALGRGELFPGPSGVSLIGMLQAQSERSRDGGLLDPSSGFWRIARNWISYEPLLVVLGTILAVASVVLIRRHPRVGLLGLASLSFWLFLGRGGETFSFYILPLLPLLAINIGLVFHLAQERLSRLAAARAEAGSSWYFLSSVRTGVATLATIVCLFLLLAGYTGANPELDRPLLLWQGTHAMGQKQALEWLLLVANPDSKMITDMYLWTDLRERADGKPPFKNAHYYWKADLDPQIAGDVFGNDWRNVDYVVATPQLINDGRGTDSLKILRAALDNSKVLNTYGSAWPVEIRAVNK